ncbi:hypothetical protein D3C79_1056730 [compost metagenome]
MEVHLYERVAAGVQGDPSSVDRCYLNRMTVIRHRGFAWLISNVQRFNVSLDRVTDIDRRLCFAR